jgi:hypothetical protein
MALQDNDSYLQKPCCPEIMEKVDLLLVLFIIIIISIVVIVIIIVIVIIAIKNRITIFGFIYVFLPFVTAIKPIRSSCIRPRLFDTATHPGSTRYVPSIISYLYM